MNILFDIDGTLADIEHRLHWIENKPKNWKKFFELCKFDDIIEPMRHLVQLYYKNNRIILATGRREEERAATIKWLSDAEIEFSCLYMRPVGDYRKDTLLKQDLLYQIQYDFGPISIAFDDRPEVIKMYRANKIFTVDVNQNASYLSA